MPHAGKRLLAFGHSLILGASSISRGGEGEERSTLFSSWNEISKGRGTGLFFDPTFFTKLRTHRFLVF